MVQKLKDVEQKETEIEQVLIQNNNLIKLVLDSTRENKSKVGSGYRLLNIFQFGSFLDHNFLTFLVMCQRRCYKFRIHFISPQVMAIKTSNTEYQREISELKGELERKNSEIRSFSDGDKVRFMLWYIRLFT